MSIIKKKNILKKDKNGNVYCHMRWRMNFVLSCVFKSIQFIKKTATSSVNDVHSIPWQQ